jgi:hypothetical protein
MPKTVGKYQKEREEILQEVFRILEVDENNNKFFLDDLDNSLQKQNDIIGIMEPVRKYFICGKWTCFVNINVKRYWFSLIKYVLKEFNYKLESHKTSKTIEKNKYKSSTYYYVVKNNPEN